MMVSNRPTATVSPADAEMKVHDAPGILPSIIARAMPLNSEKSESTSNDQTKNKDVLPASAGLRRISRG